MTETLRKILWENCFHGIMPQKQERKRRLTAPELNVLLTYILCPFKTTLRATTQEQKNECRGN